MSRHLSRELSTIPIRKKEQNNVYRRKKCLANSFLCTLRMYAFKCHKGKYFWEVKSEHKIHDLPKVYTKLHKRCVMSND